MNRRQGGLQSPSGRLGKATRPLPLPGIEPLFLGRPVCNLVTKPTKLEPNFLDHRYLNNFQSQFDCDWKLFRILVVDMPK